jgi:hypothetical protein
VNRPPARAGERPRWLVAAVGGLLVLVVWTLVVKYLVPLHWAWAERLAGRPASAPVMWDAWPLVHAALAALLWTRHPWAWLAGVAVAGAEIVVVAVKLALWASAPDAGFWKLLWLTNKLYVLAFFAALLALLLGPGRAALCATRTSARRAAGAQED